jgi:predicted RND superfamily exporter protein
MGHRGIAGLFFAAMTLFFGVGLFNVELKTIFSDLLPADDPYVKVYHDHSGFGSPLTMSVMVKRKDGGDIYNAETLRKVWDLTRDIDLTVGVDHDKIMSIATTKARYAEATPDGIDTQPLMGDSVPQTDDEIAEFRRRVDKAPGARGFLISADHTATIIEATFIERILDYGVAFDHVQALVEAARDEHHDVYLAGQPALTGWVYHYESQMLAIFAVTASLLILVLVFYMRNVVGVVVPIVTSSVAAIWGFGLVGWLKLPVEPLLMVVPLLLIARSFSHSVQFIERYYEVYAHVQDRVTAARITMGVMFAPSVLGIATDAVGIFLIALAPIPAMERFAFFAGMWALWLLPTGVFLISLLLSWLPPPSNAEKLTAAGSQTGVHAMIRFVLGHLSRIVQGRPARVTTVAVVAAGAAAIYLAGQIKIGNPVEGSNLLWPESEYNTAVRQINGHFPGVNTLEIVLESRHPNDNARRAAQQAHTTQTMAMLQALMESSDAPPTATRSYNDYMMGANRLFQGGNTKWLPIDPTDRHSQGASRAALTGGSPKDYSQVIDFNIQHSTVSFWYPNNKQETVDAALAAAERAVAVVGVDHDDFIVRMGTGTIPLQQAMNRVVERYHDTTMICLNIAMFLLCAFAFRSITAGFLLLIPVNLSNEIMVAVMHVLGIGLDVNSTLVAVVGVGIGIDYGIYLLSRICEEYDDARGWGSALTTALTTTGKAIMFTASIMLMAILPWYFLSGLKFTADMGLLLAFVMLINMVLALVVVPLLVWIVKPRFVQRRDLLVGESLDLSELSVMQGDSHKASAAV